MASNDRAPDRKVALQNSSGENGDDVRCRTWLARLCVARRPAVFEKITCLRRPDDSTNKSRRPEKVVMGIIVPKAIRIEWDYFSRRHRQFVNHLFET